MIFTLSCHSENNELKQRSVSFYLDQVTLLQVDELVSQGILIDSNTINEKYKDSETGILNKEGFTRYAEIKRDIYLSFFKDYLYLQHIEYESSVYALYFTVAGYDDLEWDIVKWREQDWSNEDNLSKERLLKDSSLSKLFWNYDEGPKNIENINLFIQNDFLVLERGNLYHSLYDLKSDSLLYNEESPWHASSKEGIDTLNQWIKVNLHDKIEKVLTEKRNG